MARSSSTAKDRILAAAYGLLYKEGFARVSVDAIAKAAGVTKRTLYYHFESKDSLVAAVLEYQHHHALARIQRWGNISVATPAEFLVCLFERVEAWASEPRWMGSGFTRLTMELADLPGHPARHAARDHKRAVEGWLAIKFEGLGVRDHRELARHVMVLLEGALSLILIHGEPSYAASAGEAARRLAERTTT